MGSLWDPYGIPMGRSLTPYFSHRGRRTSIGEE